MDASSLDHFWTHGWVRIEGVFAGEAARRMQDAIWEALADSGIERGRPGTWTVERPTALQRLKDNPVFERVGGARLRATLDAVMAGVPCATPKNWGAFFIAFPSTGQWRLPTSGWHIDAHYAGALRPVFGVKTHALIDDVVPRGGATLLLSGSHRLIHAWFRDHPPAAGARSADLRRHLQAHPYIGALHTTGDEAERIDRFMTRAELVDGVPLQVVENVGKAGDVILVHPLVLHVAAPNTAARPRFLLSGGITTDQWGWEST